MFYQIYIFLPIFWYILIYLIHLFIQILFIISATYIYYIKDLEMTHTYIQTPYWQAYQ